MELDPRLLKELTEGLVSLSLVHSMPGSAPVDPVTAIAAKLYQVGWRVKHFTGGALPSVPEPMVVALVNKLHEFERDLANPQAILTEWRAFVRRVERLGDFRCPASEQ